MVSGSLDRGVHERARAVPGLHFTGKHFLYPLTVSAVDELVAAFGAQLRVDDELSAWTRAQRRAGDELAELARQDNATLDYVSDRIWDATDERRYQRVAAAFIADTEACLIADQPGLGKTIEILAGVQEANPEAQTRYHLVLAPKIAVESVWPGEVSRWCGEGYALAFPVRGDKAMRQHTLGGVLDLRRDGAFNGLDVYVICNLEMVRIKPEKNAKGKVEWHVRNAHYPELFGVKWDTIVVDESHKALIRRGVGSDTTQVRAGIDRLTSIKRVALSGTPMRGKPEQLFGTLNWLRPDLYTSYWRWVEQYWQLYSTRYSSFNIGDFLPGGEDRLAADLRPIMLRRTKAEVLSQLPPKLYAGTFLIPDDEESPVGVWLEMSAVQAKRYQTFTDEGTVKLPGGWLIADGALAERTRRLQIAASEGSMVGERYRHKLPSPKFDWLVEFLHELGLAGEQTKRAMLYVQQRRGEPLASDEGNDARCIVTSYSTDLLNVFARELRALGIPCHLLTGDTPTAERKRMADDFQSAEPTKRVFLLNSKAGGVAITLDMADYLVMLDESTVPDDDEQVEDRAHRTSRIHQLTIYKLRMLGTVEEEVAWISAARENVQKYILDGTRGVDYAKSVYLARRQESTDKGDSKT